MVHSSIYIASNVYRYILSSSTAWTTSLLLLQPVSCHISSEAFVGIFWFYFDLTNSFLHFAFPWNEDDNLIMFLMPRAFSTYLNYRLFGTLSPSFFLFFFSSSFFLLFFFSSPPPSSFPSNMRYFSAGDWVCKQWNSEFSSHVCTSSIWLMYFHQWFFTKYSFQHCFI